MSPDDLSGPQIDVDERTAIEPKSPIQEMRTMYDRSASARLQSNQVERATSSMTRENRVAELKAIATGPRRSRSMGRSRSPRQQLVDPIDLVIANTTENIGKPSLRIDALLPWRYAQAS
jgi:hypothetical protein